MNEDAFWKLIDSTRTETLSTEELPSRLISILKDMPITSIVEFAEHLRSAVRNAYDLRLWAAATVICNYCSNDVFQDFRGWLVAQGREVYERALSNPDSLADLTALDDAEVECPRLESMLYVAEKAYKAKTGLTNFGPLIKILPAPVLKNDQGWDRNPETLQQIVPRLVNKYHKGRKLPEQTN